MPQNPNQSTRLFSDFSLDSFLAEGLTWSKLIAGPIGASGLATLFTLFGTTVLYRELPSEQAGQLAILLALLETILLVSFFGQLTMITRLHSHPEGPQHDWKRDLIGTLILSWPVLLIAVLVVAALYKLPSSLAIILAVMGLIQVPLTIIVYMLNANQHYVLSTLFLRLPNASLAIPAGLLLLDLVANRLEPVLLIWLAPTAAVLITVVLLSLRMLPDGERTMSLGERMQGLTFLASSLVSWVPEHGVIVFAGLLLPPAQLASYAAMAVFLRVFKFVASIVAMVLTPELIKRDAREQGRLAIGLGATALAGGLTMVLLGPVLARLIYSGRYADGIPLIPFLALAGTLQVFSVLPRSHHAGQLALPSYRWMIVAMLGTTGTALAIGVPLIRELGLYGMAFALILGQLARSGTLFLFWIRDRRTLLA